MRSFKEYSAKDLTVVDYRPGEDDQTKYAAQKTRVDEEPDEALNMQQRRVAARNFKRNKTKIKMGRDRAARRIANPERLKSRARKQARNTILKKLLKDHPKSDLSFARRAEIEKRLEKPAMKTKIDRLAKKMLPKVRRAELDRKRGGGSAEK
jgi:hypothetical protein